MALRTHCKHGHEYTEANTWRDQHGARQCRACWKDRSRRRDHARRQTRGTFSLKGSTFRRVKVLCARQGTPVAAFLEELLAPLLEGIEDPGSVPRGVGVRPRHDPLADLRAIEDAFGQRFSG